MHNRPPVKLVGATDQAKLDPVDIVLRLASELRGKGIQTVVVGSIQLQFFPPSAMPPSAGVGAVAAPEQTVTEQKTDVDLDTYHVESDE
jgi:hypothetical protein